MSGVREPQDVAGLVVARQPPERGHHVCAGGVERRASVLRVVRQDYHIMLAVVEATVVHKEVLDVHGIIDAALQLMLAAEVVDPYDEGFFAWLLLIHFEVSGPYPTLSATQFRNNGPTKRGAKRESGER